LASALSVLDLVAEGLGLDFGEPDQRLDRLALAEEQLSLAVVVAPMQQKALRFGRHAPLARWQVAPLVDVLADFVDQDIGRGLVLQRQLVLLRAAPACRRHRDDVAARAPVRQLFAGRLAVLIQFEVPTRAFRTVR
jgi:hypothetical protein